MSVISIRRLHGCYLMSRLTDIRQPYDTRCRLCDVRLETGLQSSWRRTGLLPSSNCSQRRRALTSCRRGCGRSRPAPRTRSRGRQPWRGQVIKHRSCSVHYMLTLQQLPAQPCVLATRRLSFLVECTAGYKWVLLKEGQEPARDAAPAGSDRAEAATNSGPGSATVGGEQGYLAGAGIEGGLGRGPEADRLRDMLRHRDDQLASLQDQLRQLESTRDRWGLTQQESVQGWLAVQR